MMANREAEARDKLNAQFEALRQAINDALYPQKGGRERCAERIDEILRIA